MMGIVDVYDALTTARPYREALTSDVALEELAAEAERGLHSMELVQAFATLSQTGQLAQRTRRAFDRQRTTCRAEAATGTGGW
jgi:HD-GYP domain-containing protein (c-di-GMP phosphodiesterase class II)